MTDIVFLLLIFFLLTSNFVTPNALKVDLPTSTVESIQMQKVTVAISKDLRFMVNQTEVTEDRLKAVLEKELGDSEPDERLVILRVDKSVPVEHLVTVASIATELEAKISIATDPK